MLAGFRGANPKIELRLTIDNTRAIEAVLLDRALDVAVVEWQVSSPALVGMPLRRDALVLVAPPGHPLAARGRIRLEDVAGQPFLLREPGSGTRALAEAALGPLVSTIVPVLELGEPEAIVRGVEAGMGLAFISRVIVARQLADRTLRELTIEGIELWRDFSLVRPRDRAPSPAARLR